jgi:hypothetical protein
LETGMELFRRILRKIAGERYELEDEFFRHLFYMDSYWEAKRSFSPTGTEIELFIDAPGDKQPPNLQQREFFAQVERDYTQLMADIERMARPMCESWFRKPLEGPFEQEFTIGSFSIPLPSDGVAVWEISFDSRTDPEHSLIVLLRGSEPTHATMDG